MKRVNQTQVALFFQQWLLRQQAGWGNPIGALQELEHLMQWHLLQAPANTYKRHF